MKKQINVLPASGKLGVLTPGLGAVATTFIAGVIASRKGMGHPVGSLTQMGRIRIGKRTDNNQPLIKDFVPLTNLDQMVFGGWDIFEDNVYQAATHARVLDQQLLDAMRPELEQIKPMSAVFDSRYVRNISGPNVKSAPSKMDLAEQLMADIQQFKSNNGCDRLVMVWCASTEAYIEPELSIRLWLLSNRACATTILILRPLRFTLMQRSSRAFRLPMARRILLVIFRPFLNCLCKPKWPSAARTSKPAKH